jgi:predicted nucleotidyltransferase/plasmid stability protein
MPVSFSVKNVPDRVAKALRARATRNHRSLQGELLAILTAAAEQPSRTTGRGTAQPLGSATPVHKNAPYARRTAAADEVRETAEPWGDESDGDKNDEFGRPLAAPALPIPTDKIADLCRRWKVKELALFGSVLRDDFRPASDVDVLVEFEPDDTWSLFDLMEMKDELAELFGRRVDLVERAAVEQSPNWIRRRHILENQRVIYAA